MHSCIRLNFLATILVLGFTPFFASAQSRPVPLLPLDSLGLTGMQGCFTELLGTTNALETILQEKTPALDSLQRMANNQWMLAKMDTTSSKILLDSLGKEAKAAASRYKKAAGILSKVEKHQGFIASVNPDDSLALRKNLPKIWKQTSLLYEDVFPPEPKSKVDSTAATVEKPRKEKKTESAPDPSVSSNPGKRFAAYDPAKDVMLNPPTPACVIASSSRDEFSGEISKEMSRAELFRFTNPALRTYLQGKTHVICEAALSSTGPNNHLILTFTINDPNARKAFGRLDKNSIATLKFMDESIFTLQNTVPDDGVFNPETGATIFRAQYPVNPELFKKMRRVALDKLRIAWSNGYDDYEVQQVDLLMRQVECLLK